MLKVPTIYISTFQYCAKVGLEPKIFIVLGVSGWRDRGYASQAAALLPAVSIAPSVRQWDCDGQVLSSNPGRAMKGKYVCMFFFK